MGNVIGDLMNKEPPSPMVLVPPIFDFPPLAARTRMLIPAYDLLFGKLALRCLFEDYFEEVRNFSTRIMLKPLEDPHVDMIATVSGPLEQKSDKHVEGNALFRWQRDLDDPHTFLDFFVSTSKPNLRLRSCAYYPEYGFGAFGIFPLLVPNRVRPEDYGSVGLRYGSENLSIGTTFMPFPLSSQTPVSAWLVGRLGRLSAGVQYTPPNDIKYPVSLKDLKNWSCAIGYGLGSSSPLSPSFNFAIELVRSSQLIASFYQHVVVQRRIAASWQANKNFLVKGKVGPVSSSIVLAFKSWWKPAFTFSLTASNDRLHGTTAYGFGLRAENLRDASYERADPNYVMLTPNREHLAEGVLRNFGKRPVFQSEINSGNYDRLPRELKPIGKIF
ncbi:uncharacterized protein A4U43_C05F11130 [Asparagus officinalis]|uniref:Uncharacterized protein n=1 Tax=Asparagus officinalis TaxID=4686 RepID=A0A5P1EV74_ASPOF|nr:uncharacterized protein A4U43_C05F11130 [Asparagus officinalis]